MRYLGAYMLAQLGGNRNPQAEDIKTILGSVGIECEAERVKLLLDQLKGKNIHDLIASGRTKLSTVSVGGGSAPVASGAVDHPVAAGAAPVAKVEEKKPESSSESEADMGFSLFD